MFSGSLPLYAAQRSRSSPFSPAFTRTHTHTHHNLRPQLTAFIPADVTSDAVMDAVRMVKTPKGRNTAVKSVDFVALQKA